MQWLDIMCSSHLIYIFIALCIYLRWCHFLKAEHKQKHTERNREKKKTNSSQTKIHFHKHLWRQRIDRLETLFILNRCCVTCLCFIVIRSFIHSFVRTFVFLSFLIFCHCSFVVICFSAIYLHCIFASSPVFTGAVVVPLFFLSIFFSLCSLNLLHTFTQRELWCFFPHRGWIHQKRDIEWLCDMT